MRWNRPLNDAEQVEQAAKTEKLRKYLNNLKPPTPADDFKDNLIRNPSKFKELTDLEKALHGLEHIDIEGWKAAAKAKLDKPKENLNPKNLETITFKTK